MGKWCHVSKHPLASLTQELGLMCGLGSFPGEGEELGNRGWGALYTWGAKRPAALPVPQHLSARPRLHLPVPSSRRSKAELPLGRPSGDKQPARPFSSRSGRSCLEPPGWGRSRRRQRRAGRSLGARPGPTSPHRPAAVMQARAALARPTPGSRRRRPPRAVRREGGALPALLRHAATNPLPRGRGGAGFGHCYANATGTPKKRPRRQLAQSPADPRRPAPVPARHPSSQPAIPAAVWT